MFSVSLPHLNVPALIPGYIAFFQQLADDDGTGLNPPSGFLLPPPTYIFDKLMVSVDFGHDPAFFPAENNAFCALVPLSIPMNSWSADMSKPLHDSSEKAQFQLGFNSYSPKRRKIKGWRAGKLEGWEGGMQGGYEARNLEAGGLKSIESFRFPGFLATQLLSLLFPPTLHPLIFSPSRPFVSYI